MQSALAAFCQEISQTLSVFFQTQYGEAAAINTSLAESLSHLETFSLRGGKAIRSFLVKLGYELASGAPHPDLVKIAAAIDLHHKHILILDDIADRDEKRYGGDTLEYAYRKVFAAHKEQEHRARTFAMLDAVWLGALSKELILQTHFDAQKLLAVIHVLNTTMFRDTLAGWQIHGLECDKPIDAVTPEEFVKGLELVTARYTFTGPLKIGLILADNKNTKLEIALDLYAQKIGTAFQIQDDILGLFGQTEKTGKPVGNDVREGKKTLLVQYAYAHVDKKEQLFLSTALGNPKISQADIVKVQKIVTDSGALEASMALERQMVTEGIKALDELSSSPAKQMLIALAQLVITREQ